MYERTHPHPVISWMSGRYWVRCHCESSLQNRRFWWVPDKFIRAVVLATILLSVPSSFPQFTSVPHPQSLHCTHPRLSQFPQSKMVHAQNTYACSAGYHERKYLTDHNILILKNNILSVVPWLEPLLPSAPFSGFFPAFRDPAARTLLLVFSLWINQSINQSTNQPTNQPTNQSINQSINRSINQSINQSRSLVWIGISLHSLNRIPILPMAVIFSVKFNLMSRFMPMDW